MEPDFVRLEKNFERHWVQNFLDCLVTYFQNLSEPLERCSVVRRHRLRRRSIHQHLYQDQYPDQYPGQYQGQYRAHYRAQNHLPVHPRVLPLGLLPAHPLHLQRSGLNLTIDQGKRLSQDLEQMMETCFDSARAWFGRSLWWDS